MPKGKTHDQIAIISSGPLFFTYLYISSSLWISSVFIISFLFGSFMLSPDLDTRSKSYFRWGILRFIWLPYNIVFKHRSKLTHGLILSPLIRLIYLMGIVIIITIVSLSLYDITITHNFIYKSFNLGTYDDVLYAIVCGIVISNLWHVVLDNTVTFCKKMYHKV